MLESELHAVVTALITATQQSEEAFKDAETRQQAVIALANVSKTMGLAFPTAEVFIFSPPDFVFHFIYALKICF